MTTSARALVTIGISTYNRADTYLKDALQSALDQTYPALEILVSDNCSTDGTEALVQGMADTRVRYFRQTRNIGPNNNFNYCLEQARGAYFVLLHDDDLIDPDFVESCMDAVHDDTTVGMIRSGTRIIDARGAVQGAVPNRVGGPSTVDFMLGWFAGQTALYLCSTLFNTQRLREVGGFKSRTDLLQDVVAQMRLAARYGRADVEPVKASFRRHGDNRGSAARARDWMEDALYLLDVMCELAPAERRAEVQRLGSAYFARMSYRHAAGISPLVERLQAYRLVHRSFGYTYSPLRFVARRRLDQLRRLTRLLLAGNGARGRRFKPIG